MSERIALHVLKRADIEAGTWYAQWQRGEELARMTPEKRALVLANPYSSGPDEPLQIIGTKGTRVIGRIDLIWGRVRLAAAEAPVAWGSQFFVPEEDRDTMMGAMLLMKVQQLCPIAGAHGPSQMALPLYQKLKWNDIPLQRWILLRRSRSIVRRYVGSGAAGAAARVAVDLGLAGHRVYAAARRVARTLGLEARRVERMPGELAAALDEADARRGGVARGARSVEWFNWLLAHRFGGDETGVAGVAGGRASRHERALYLVHVRGVPRPVGYFFLKVKFYPVATHRRFPDLTLASLADVGVFDPSVFSLEAATHMAFLEAGELGADALEVCDAVGARRGFYKGLGFLPAGQMHLVIRGAPGTPLADARWKDPAAWDFRLGDGENVPI